MSAARGRGAGVLSARPGGLTGRYGAVTALTFSAAAALAFASAILIPVSSVPVALAVVVAAALVGWMLFTQRYELSLAGLMVYIALVDGFLKLKTGNDYATVGRDVLLYAIVAGAAVRIVVRRRSVERPPLTGWIVAFVLVALVQVANPNSASPLHSVGGLRPHLEWVPLFFLGYAAMRTARRLRIFLMLLLVVTTINGVVALAQYRLTPEQLATWGPGYAELLQGTGTLAERVSYGSDDERRVRPFGLGSDTGFSGSLAILAAPAAMALIALARRRWARITGFALAGGVVLALLTAQTRISLLAAAVAVLAFAAMTTVSRRRVQTLLTAALSLAVAALVASYVVSTTTLLLDRYQTLSTSFVIDYKRNTFAALGEYVTEYPFGAGLGSVGPATDFAGGPSPRPLNGESEFNFLVIELGLPGLLLLCAFVVRILVPAVARVRRVADAEVRVLLTAVLAGFVAVVAIFVGAPVTATTPGGPFFWLAAGTLTWWLISRGTEPALARRAAWPSPTSGAPRASRARRVSAPSIDDRPPPSAPAQSPLPTRAIVEIAYPRLDATRPDSIAAYSARLAAALDELGGIAVRCRSPDDALAHGRDPASLPRTVLLQYNPFSYGRLGFAPGLVRGVHQARRRPGAPAIALMVHEPFVALDGARTWVLTGWQRAQLRALCAGADTILAASEAWAATVQRLIRGRQMVLHVPVGSTLPDRRADRAAARRLLTVGDREVVIAHLGTRHASRLDGHVVAAVNAVAGRRPVVLLNLGADAPPLRGLASGVRTHSPGWIDNDALACTLSAADVFLSPCVDGVSTRRTSLMAALQHQIAVVGTVTTTTDAVLRESAGALRLAAVEDVAGFANATAALAEDERDRRRVAQAARRLYEQHFDWPVIAARLRDVLRLDPA